MALQYINTGTSPNKGNGDTIRAAFDKVNYNFNVIKSISILATTDTVATLTNLIVEGTLDVLSTASFTTKTLTLSNNQSDSNGAGIIISNSNGTPATLLYNNGSDIWETNKALFAPSFYANGSPVITITDLGDARFINDNNGAVVLSTINTDEDIRIDPNGSGRLVLSGTSMMFDNGAGTKPEGHLLYSAPNALPVGLGIGTDNDSLRIVGDASNIGTVVDIGLYNGDSNTWTSLTLVDSTGAISTKGNIIAPAVQVDAAIINSRALQISSPFNLTIDGAPVLPLISPTIPVSSIAGGNSGEMAYRGSNLYICTSGTSWIKLVGLTGTQWDTTDTIYIGNNALSVSTITNTLVLNGSTAISPIPSYLINGLSTATLTVDGKFITPSLLSTGTLYQGTAFDSIDYTDTAIRVDADTNSYAQSIFINHNLGTNASSDIVLMNNSGTDVTNFIDLGINGTNYTVPEYGVTQPGDGYLFNNGGNLAIGTQSVGTDLVFHAGGTLAENIGGRLSATSWTFNRSVLVTVNAPSVPLTFTIQNGATVGDAKAEYQAVDGTFSNYVRLGIVAGGSSAGFGPVKVNESYLYTSGIGDIFHIGNKSTIAFYADSTDGYNAVPAFTIDHEHQFAILDRTLLPYENNQYDLGSSTATWNQLYVNTATIGGYAIGVTTSSNITIDGAPALPTISYDIPTSSTSTGVTGQMATTGTSLYVCVAPDSWLKFSGATF